MIDEAELEARTYLWTEESVLDGSSTAAVMVTVVDDHEACACMTRNDWAPIHDMHRMDYQELEYTPEELDLGAPHDRVFK